MLTDLHTLPSATPGTQRQLRRLRFGPASSRRMAYLQAALHADEVPALLVAHHLAEGLAALEQAGGLREAVHLVPMANPLGLAQEHLGLHQGRFEQGSGGNFNRQFLHLTPLVLAQVREQVKPGDAAHNQRVVREALAQVMSERCAQATSEVEALKRQLQAWAVPADLVLDLHCDNQGVMHLYTTPQAQARVQPLADWLQAEAVLLAEVSGGDPFDESLSRTWPELQAELGDEFPLGLGCDALTVELRGETDVSHELARQDAQALLRFLAHEGYVDAAVLDALFGPAERPASRCQPSRLDAVETFRAPHPGVVVYRCHPGDDVQAGQVVADIVCPFTGRSTPLVAQHGGRFYARPARRHASRGMALAKLAGTVTCRSGALLSL